MDLTTFALDLTKITAVFIGTLFLGVPLWLKSGRHWYLLTSIPIAIALTLSVKNELPLVTGFTPMVIAALVLAHVAATGLIAAMIYPSTKARLKKELEEAKQKAFFNISADGGSAFAPAYEQVLEIAKEFPTTSWNKYEFRATNEDSSESDTTDT